MRERRGYAICTVPRSGSNWVCRLLASTGVLGKPLEYFFGHGLRLFTDPAYPDDPTEQLTRVLTAGATANGVYGVKVFPWQLDLVSPHVRWTDALPNLRFVHLARRDLLGQAMSVHRAEQTQQWRSTLPAQGEAAYDGDAILSHLRRLVREQGRWASYFARTGIEPVRLIYEELVDRPQAAVDAVAELMHVEAPTVGDADRLGMAIQRDSVTEEWRARFRAEHGDGNAVDAI